MDAKKPRFDSVMLDMDGTLWDAVDTYRAIWNEAFSALGIDHSVTRQQLIDCMGMPLEAIAKRLNPADVDSEAFFAQIRRADEKLMPSMGGKLYPGVAELIPQLAKDFKLFMVSNCGPHGLDYFLDFTGLRPYITDCRTYGATGVGKDTNILDLIHVYNLSSPVYIGDTQGDADCAHRAGIPIIHAAYGFGHCSDAEFSADSFARAAQLLYEP